MDRIKEFEEKYKQGIYEPFRPVITHYIITQKPRILEETQKCEKPLEYVIANMIFFDFSIRSRE